MPKLFHYSIEINASPDQVWDAITNPEMTRKFMYNCVPITDWKIGSEILWRGSEDGVDYVKGYIKKYNPKKTLAFSVFDPNGNYEDIPDNYLVSEYNLVPENEGTRIDITQGDYAVVAEGEKRFGEAHAGWDFALTELKKILEGNKSE